MTEQERQVCIDKIAALPSLLRAAITGATDDQLSKPYRDGGWNSRQVIHHLADSHMMAYIRFKKTVAEDHPTLQAYNQDVWASHGDGWTGPLEPSLSILDGVHARWAAFLRALPETAWSRTAIHQERGPMTLEDLLRIYSGHGEKHIGHIKAGLAA
ncbi:MAG TPA: putative metal-dependent hydrolase [Bryobacteraceae bacterium]|nr:putative metal-dependent hydrolase [Bryobacteraceae bacterium]HPT28864.1 putative metal-dependent hydrolase [Bryobacteraceae bacterium]